MSHWFHQTKHNLKEWLIREVHSVRAQYILGFISFIESAFFPVPPDFFLVPMVLATPKKWFRLSTIVTLTSVMGAFAGYFVGAGLFEVIAEPLINFYDLHEEVLRVGQLYNDNTFLAIFLSAFTPIPFKVFTITAGMFKVNLLAFGVAALIGRGLRFYLEGFVFSYFGEHIKKSFYRYINIFTVIAIVVVLVWIIFK